MQATPHMASGPTSAGRRRIEVLRRIVLYAMLTVLAFCFALPLLWMISTSLKSESEILAFTPSFLPRVPLWENYVTTFDTVKGGGRPADHYVPFSMDNYARGVSECSARLPSICPSPTSAIAKRARSAAVLNA